MPTDTAPDDSRYAHYTRLQFDRPHPKVLRITMANGRMNTADHAMHRELSEIWRDVDADPSVNAAIITGAGKVFSAGGDFGMIEDIISDFEKRARIWKEARDIVYTLINCSKPVVSAMRGVAVGAGLVCGILADVSIATRDCRIIDGHTRLGVAAGDHAAIIWPLLCGMAKAKYYLLACDQLLGEEAERIGLISLVTDDAGLDARAVDVLHQRVEARFAARAAHADDGGLAFERDERLQHERRRAKRLPGAAHVLLGAEHPLALAVIAEPSRLQHGGQAELRDRTVEVLLAGDRSKARGRNAE